MLCTYVNVNNKFQNKSSVGLQKCFEDSTQSAFFLLEQQKSVTVTELI